CAGGEDEDVGPGLDIARVDYLGGFEAGSIGINFVATVGQDLGNSVHVETFGDANGADQPWCRRVSIAGCEGAGCRLLLGDDGDAAQRFLNTRRAGLTLNWMRAGSSLACIPIPSFVRGPLEAFFVL